MNASVNASVHTYPTMASHARHVVFRTRGVSHGPVTRLVSPSDIGEMIKPFVFLDLFDVPSFNIFGQGFGWHPHSGIATLTLAIEGDFIYQETTGPDGILHTGGVEWMRASHGAWHTGRAHSDGPLRGFQLWVAMPPELENAPAVSQHLAPDQVPADGPARVLLGRSGNAVSLLTLTAPSGINYLDVRLAAGERWTYRPPQGHLVGWVAVHSGKLCMPDPVGKGELVVFDRSDAAIDFQALTDTRFVLGSAVPHPHELVLGHYSVHTSRAALEKGEREIGRIGRVLRGQGVLKPALSGASN